MDLIMVDGIMEGNMNFKKTILFLLFSIFILIIIYNYGLPFFSIQYNSGMGMHESYGYYNNSITYYGNFISLIIFILSAMIVIIAVIKIFSTSGQKKCKKCGLTIENHEWKICPRCGNTLKDGSVNER
ncbi:hypothetical protein [Anaerocolumna chitinilytica]|nr:hypothetical protein [Anaerocolumna chitinilytica]